MEHGVPAAGDSQWRYIGTAVPRPAAASCVRSELRVVSAVLRTNRGYRAVLSDRGDLKKLGMQTPSQGHIDVRLLRAPRNYFLQPRAKQRSGLTWYRILGNLARLLRSCTRFLMRRLSSNGWRHISRWLVLLPPHSLLLFLLLYLARPGHETASMHT